MIKTRKEIIEYIQEYASDEYETLFDVFELVKKDYIELREIYNSVHDYVEEFNQK